MTCVKGFVPEQRTIYCNDVCKINKKGIGHNCAQLSCKITHKFDLMNFCELLSIIIE
jgi:hypothetical protein